MSVTVRAARSDERGLIEQLFQFYAYDFSEMEPADSPRFDVDETGCFGVRPLLESYWSDAEVWPLLIEDGDRTIGFALLNTHSHRGGRCARNMAEFFVLRKYRGGGRAADALNAIFALHPGAWEIAVAARNTLALRFWSRAIAAAPGVANIDIIEGDGDHWTGPIWCFDIRS